MRRPILAVLALLAPSVAVPRAAIGAGHGATPSFHNAEGWRNLLAGCNAWAAAMPGEGAP